MGKKIVWAKRCSECGKVLSKNSKSLLCEYHCREKYRKENKEKEPITESKGTNNRSTKLPNNLPV